MFTIIIRYNNGRPDTIEHYENRNTASARMQMFHDIIVNHSCRGEDLYKITMMENNNIIENLLNI